MVFSIAYSGKIWLNTFRQLIIALLSFVAVILFAAVYEHDAAVWLNASDAIVGVGLGLVLFVFILRQKKDANIALALLLVYVIAYCFFRNWIFAPTLSSISQQMTPMYETYLKRIPSLNISKDAVNWVQQTMLNYQSAIWGSIQVAGVFLGILLFNKTSLTQHPVRFIKLPYEVVLLMIAALGLTLYPVTRLYGTNLLICMSMIYLIQGTAVLCFAWGGFFAKARLLRTFLIMAIILNYPVLILIALIGLLDVWFDFRKLTLMEEKHESDIN
jgi:hypothetical protein